MQSRATDLAIWIQKWNISKIKGENFGKYRKVDLCEETLKAEIGYTCMNIIEPPTGMIWGWWNDHVLDPMWVTKLLSDFLNNLENSSEKNTMEVALKRSWIHQQNQTLLPSARW